MKHINYEGCTLKPILDRLIIVKVVETEITKSGLFIPSGGKGDAHYGRVISVGSGFRKADGGMFPLNYKPGDYVLYGRGCGHSIFVNGIEHIILKDDNVLAIYRGELDVIK